MKNLRPSSFRAFTLVEVLVAIFFMSIALTAYIALNARLAIGDDKIINRVQNVELDENLLVQAPAGDTPDTSAESTVTSTPISQSTPPGMAEYDAYNKWIDQWGSHVVEIGTRTRDNNLWW